MNKKNIFIAMLIIGITGVFVAYKMYNKPHVNVAETKAGISITADKILNDFSSDETAANTTYLGKIIEVKGKVSKTKTVKEKGIIILKTNDDFGGVSCHLSEAATKKMSNIKEGQSISLKGICTGYLMDVIFVKCEILTK